MFDFPVLHRQRLTCLVSRAVRRRVTLVSGPAGAGKTVACAMWAAVQPERGQILWLAVGGGQDQAWFWADIYARLRRACLIPHAAAAYLEETSPDAFPLRLAEVARQFALPAVLILDNAHMLADSAVISGLDVLIQHAPPTLSLLFCGQRAPRVQLNRLRSAGELAVVKAADLRCTADEAAAFLTLLGLELTVGNLERLLARSNGLIGGLRHAAAASSPRTGEDTRRTGRQPSHGRAPPSRLLVLTRKAG